MKVGITFNLKRSETELDEFDRPVTIEAIKRALEARGHKVKLYEATSPLLFYSLTIDRPQFVFNIAEGKYGAYREAFVPALLDELRIPYTGSSVLSLAISMDKVMTKEVLLYHGIPTPKFKVLKVIDPIEIGDLNYPVIVKPIFEGSSIGITSKSICENDIELKEAAEKAFRKFKRPIMVEEFIGGMEVTVGVMGNFPPQVLPPMEIDFSTLSKRELKASPYIQTYKFKTDYSDKANYYLPARLPVEVLQKITEIVKNAFIALRNRDVARFDLRVDKNYNPYILEVNPLPGLDPEHSDLPRIYKLMGKTYGDLINDILQVAVERYRLETKISYNHEE
ncbi:D-alanine--D-alanine ligase family protein [Caldisericum exile]|uniref:D-alanine--D-alanine ligase n=1 Tax=Caldisericum exile (strain DSM 21853 / NBRC 104410 / AZM16c01) TaxID=511051 RepID=A0A7U6JFI7_CALEA|nr:D-alanine--D-alanine ligase [Caldisericum exile]BAL81558.1 putative D-alanine--D-alanine ligase [Caldisericum exile AZM16c01]